MKKNTDYDGEIFLLNDKYLLLSDLMTITKDTKIELDLGCGTGDLALGLAERYPDRLIFAADIKREFEHCELFAPVCLALYTDILFACCKAEFLGEC